MPKLEIESSILIEAPISEVYNLVSEYKRWPEWSPWLVAEREAVLEFGDDGRSYSWDGAIVGSGNMQLLEDETDTSLKMQLTLLTPWKSKSEVHFQFEKAYDNTRVTWRMNGSLPFFMFFLRSMMETLIEMDYERGLRMLKDLVENGSVPSTIELKPEASHPNCQYVGIVRNCSMAEMPDCMGADFGKLKDYFAENQIQLSAPAFSIYSKWNLSKGFVEYTACFPVD